MLLCYSVTLFSGNKIMLSFSRGRHCVFTKNQFASPMLCSVVFGCISLTKEMQTCRNVTPKLKTHQKMISKIVTISTDSKYFMNRDTNTKKKYITPKNIYLSIVSQYLQKLNVLRIVIHIVWALKNRWYIVPWAADS